LKVTSDIVTAAESNNQEVKSEKYFDAFKNLSEFLIEAGLGSAVKGSAMDEAGKLAGGIIGDEVISHAFE
jgi:hypothetical protein